MSGGYEGQMIEEVRGMNKNNAGYGKLGRTVDVGWKGKSNFSRQAGWGAKVEE